MWEFQSTLPHREWLLLSVAKVKHFIFQSTLPHREWRSPWWMCLILARFQSTLPHREWQDQDWLLFCYMVISIHTPAQGVTIGFNRACKIVDISIHTPAQGVTNLYWMILILLNRFQSTLPHREWLDFIIYTFPKINFNPHSRTGSDLYMPLFSSLS